MPRQLFGTDGIRGVAGKPPLDQVTVLAFGQALGEWALQHSNTARVLIGMDTRESGPALAGFVRDGLHAAGARVDCTGVITTPGVAWLTRTGPYAAGVMISASHNPFQDNGLKVFAHSGYKLPDQEELALEKRIFQLVGGAPLAAVKNEWDEVGHGEAYVNFLRSTVSEQVAGWKIVVDCANGAASAHAPALLKALGMDVVAIHNEPNGRNINLNCGALHPESMQARVVAEGARLGVAFDGDADRAIFAGPSGARVTGDHLLFICGADAQERGCLPGDLIVATVMSNLGLELALQSRGIRLVRTNVGDKYVLEEMIRLGAAIGGEQSGHVIFHEQATTGDGILTLLRLLDVLARKDASLDDLSSEMQILPQTLVNVRFGRKRPLQDLDTVQTAIGACEQEFGASGRVLVRFSGTEPLARVMVEGPSEDRVHHHAAVIAAAIERELAVS